MPGLEHAAVLEPEVGRRQRGQPADRVGKRRDLLVADIFAEEAREIAVGARMRAAI